MNNWLVHSMVILRELEFKAARNHAAEMTIQVELGCEIARVEFGCKIVQVGLECVELIVRVDLGCDTW